MFHEEATRKSRIGVIEGAIRSKRSSPAYSRNFFWSTQRNVVVVAVVVVVVVVADVVVVVLLLTRSERSRHLTFPSKNRFGSILLRPR